MTGSQNITKGRGARSRRRWVLTLVSVLAAGLALASTAWACSVINGTTEAYQQPNSNGPEVSTLNRGTTYHFRGNGAHPIGSNYNAFLWLLGVNTYDNCQYPGAGPTEVQLAPPPNSPPPTIDSDGDIPLDNRSQTMQATDGNQPTVPGTIPATYLPGPAKLCFTNEQDWHSVPKAVTIL